PQSFFSQTTGKTYRWGTVEEFELVKEQLEQDGYIEAQRVIAALRDTDKDSQSRILEAYTFAKNEVLNPSVLNPETGAWRSMTDITPEALEEQFRAGLVAWELTPEEMEKAVELFNGFIAKIPEALPGAGEGAPPSEGGVWQNLRDLATPARASLGAGGAVAAALRNRRGERSAPDVPEPPRPSVDNEERPFYEQLASVIDNPEIGSEAQALRTRIETERVPQDELQRLLEELLARLAPDESRRFEFRRIPPQSSVPQGDPMAAVTNMLRKV
ncbi:hypothetical protein LCGC14_2116350, partial [marine sediment metagenome]